MSNNILFIFEGEKSEKQITNNLKKHFIKDNAVILCSYCNNIYHLQKELSEDKDLDTFSLLKESPMNKELLSSYNRDDFAEIYMFFDYDAHDTSADDEKLKETLDFFNEETMFGKLFISYPMAEAIKHYSESISFNELKVKAKENIKYKQIVHCEAQNELKQITKYTKQIWIKLIELHLKKMNYITNGTDSLPTECISQIDIFEKQLEKYINIDSTVAVLSSFPIFIFDYYGYAFILKLIS